MPCNTPYRGDSAQLLLYKIASCCFAGGGGAGVSSFNGRTGAVTLLASDVSTVADDLYVNESGDSMTGALFIDNGVLAASAPALSLSQTWNNAAVTFTGLFANYTNTASASDSNLFNFQTDGMDRFRFATIGQLFATRQDATNSGVTFFQRKRGSLAGATSAVAADATIGTLTHSGWDGTAYANGSRISGLANTLWTNTNHGSRIDLYTTPDGSTSEQVTLRLAATGQSLFTDGNMTNPSLSFQSDLNTGIYRVGADNIGFAIGGALGMSLTGSSLSLTSKTIILSNFFAVSWGTTSALIYGDSTSNTLVFTTGSVDRITVSTTDLALTAGFRLSMASGANQRAGNAVLVAGTVTVANTSVTANTIVLLTRKTAGGTLGTAITYTVSAGTSFTINSDSIVDTSTFSYLLIEVP